MTEVDIEAARGWIARLNDQEHAMVSDPRDAARMATAEQIRHTIGPVETLIERCTSTCSSIAPGLVTSFTSEEARSLAWIDRVQAHINECVDDVTDLECILMASVLQTRVDLEWDRLSADVRGSARPYSRLRTA